MARRDRDPLSPLLAVFLWVWRDAKGSWHVGSRKPSRFPRLHDDTAVNLPWRLEGPSGRHLTGFVFLLQQQPRSGALCTPGSLAWPRAEPEQPPQDCSTDGGNRITQLTQDMAEEVLLMAQSLRSRGRLLVRPFRNFGGGRTGQGGSGEGNAALQAWGSLHSWATLLLGCSALRILARSLLSLSTVS